MNGDNPVLAAVIAAISTVIVGFMSSFASKKDDSTPSQNKIYELELEMLWVPLDKALSYHAIQNPSELLQKIESIIIENYKLVPPEFLKEFLKLKETEEIHPAHFLKLKIITGSYFNWTRKRLGYPYERRRIRIEYSPSFKKSLLLTTIGNIIMLTITIIIGIMMIFCIIMLYENDRLSGTDYIALLAAFFGIVATSYLAFNQRRK